MSSNIIVIGAGVNGLCTSIELLKIGHSVTIFSCKPPLETTATVAAAIWDPYGVGPEEKVLNWARNSLEIFYHLQNDPESGVVWRNHTEFFNTEIPKPSWMTLLPDGNDPGCNIPKNIACMHSVNLPVIDTTKFMRYLHNQFLALGGKLELKKIENLDALKQYPIIINCSGLGARELFNDNNIYPIKGQRFSIKQPKDKITESILHMADKNITLVTSHQDHVVIGVSFIEHDSTLNYDDQEEINILERAKQFFPQLSDINILERKVGLRPGRIGGVRLEIEKLNNQKIIHNYGHSSAGVTLSFGCATNVIDLM